MKYNKQVAGKIVRSNSVANSGIGQQVSKMTSAISKSTGVKIGLITLGIIVVVFALHVMRNWIQSKRALNAAGLAEAKQAQADFIMTKKENKIVIKEDKQRMREYKDFLRNPVKVTPQGVRRPRADVRRIKRHMRDNNGNLPLDVQTAYDSR